MSVLRGMVDAARALRDALPEFGWIAAVIFVMVFVGVTLGSVA